MRQNNVLVEASESQTAPCQAKKRATRHEIIAPYHDFHASPWSSTVKPFSFWRTKARNARLLVDHDLLPQKLTLQVQHRLLKSRKRPRTDEDRL